MTHTIQLVACHLLFLLLAVHGFKLLGVGAPRTGTQSLDEAMRILKLRSLHGDTCLDCENIAYDYLFAGGSLEPVMKQLEAYDVAMDEPYHLLYPEVLERFPEAKFVLTTQPSPENWYRSFLHLMTESHSLEPRIVEGLNTTMLQVARNLRGIEHHGRPRGLKGIPNLVDLSDNPYVKGSWFNQAEAARYFNCEFTAPVQTSKMVQQCIDGYTQHNANVLQSIPPEKLLVFNLTDGWEPLCQFLNVPIPSEPFPFVDRHA